MPRSEKLWGDAELPDQQGISNDAWLIYFEDKGMHPEVFVGEENTRRRFEQLQQNWSVHLFRSADSKDAFSNRELLEFIDQLYALHGHGGANSEAEWWAGHEDLIDAAKATRGV